MGSIAISDPKRCSGCRACEQVCPHNCITMQRDAEGFHYPQVDTTRCTQCGLCERVCPFLHPAPPRKPLRISALQAVEEHLRTNASSGGLFYLLAEQTLQRGGVVFGAGFDAQWRVCHQQARTIEEVQALTTSKYVQSDTADTFRAVKRLLGEGVEVLYVGTPCQIAGLRAFLARPHENLLLVDFICHGVPSPAVWEHYLNYRTARLGWQIGEITHISFRDKRKGWRNYSLTLRAGEQEYSAPMKSEPYLRGFQENLYLRPSCSACKAKRFRSGSDLTLSDFWNIRRYLPEWDDDRGSSLLHICTEKGLRRLEGLNCQRSDLQHYRYQEMAYSSTTLHPKRKGFFEGLARGEEFDTLVAKLLKKRLFARQLKQLRKLITRLKHRHENCYTDPTATL